VPQRTPSRGPLDCHLVYPKLLSTAIAALYVLRFLTHERAPASIPVALNIVSVGDGEVELAVSDSGIGMTPSNNTRICSRHISRLFRRFSAG
jgi:hypothetical protein